MDSSVDVCDLMINLLCTTCSDRACAEDEGQHDEPIWSHSKLMDCIREKFVKPEDLETTQITILRGALAGVLGSIANIVEVMEDGEHGQAYEKLNDLVVSIASTLRPFKDVGIYLLVPVDEGILGTIVGYRTVDDAKEGFKQLHGCSFDEWCDPDSDAYAELKEAGITTKIVKLIRTS